PGPLLLHPDNMARTMDYRYRRRWVWCELCRSAFEAPASSSKRLGGSDSKGGVKHESVKIPGRRPGARSAVRSHECIALHLYRPSILAVQLGQPLQRWLIDDPASFAFQYKVDSLQFDRDRAGRVFRQIARLARLRPTDQIQIAIVPKRTERGGVRATIRARRAKEKCEVNLRRASREEIMRPAPRQFGISIPVKIGDLTGSFVGHLLASLTFRQAQCT